MKIAAGMKLPPLIAYVLRYGVRCLLVLLASVCALGALAHASAPPKSITVVMDDNYPPYSFHDSEGNLQGIHKDTWDLWSKKPGFK